MRKDYNMKGGKFIRCELLNPGDVILSCGNEKHSKAIARMTKGPYSHACFALTATYRFESLMDGIGFSYREIDRAEYHPSEGHRLLEDVSDFRRITVYRHPSITGKELERVKEQLPEILQQFFGLQYPKLLKLAQASSNSPNIRRFLSVLLDMIDKISGHHPIVPGPFCSQLIALVFEMLNLNKPLFPSKRASDTVNPNDLAHSNLQEIPNILCEVDETSHENPQLAKEINEMNPSLSREQLLSPLVTGKVLLKLFEDLYSKHDHTALRENLKPEVKRLAQRILEIVKTTIGDMLDRHQPHDEHDLNEKLGALLRSHESELHSEHPTASFACASVVPDHVHKKIDLLIKAKYLRDSTSSSKATEGIASDLTKYPKNSFILFIVYDPQHRIRNDGVFTREIEEKGRNWVVIIR